MTRSDEDDSANGGMPRVWWEVLSEEGPFQHAETNYTCSADKYTIRIIRSTDEGGTDQSCLIEYLRKKGVSKRLLNDLNWVTPIYDPNESDGPEGIPRGIHSIIIRCRGETILPATS